MTELQDIELFDEATGPMEPIMHTPETPSSILSDSLDMAIHQVQGQIDAEQENRSAAQFASQIIGMSDCRARIAAITGNHYVTVDHECGWTTDRAHVDQDKYSARFFFPRNRRPVHIISAPSIAGLIRVVGLFVQEAREAAQREANHAP